MDFSQLEERISSYGPSGYYLIESFLLKILEAEAKAHNQDLILGTGNQVSTYDAFAPNGFSDINGPVSIEIIRSLSANRILRESHKYTLYLEQKSESLLLISISGFPKNTEDFVRRQFYQHKAIHIWGPSDIQNLINRHKSFASDLSENLFSNRFRIAIDSKTEDWKLQRENIVNAVRDQYRSGRFSIFLGAGVSSSAGLPDWDTLLNSLFVTMLTEDATGSSNLDAENLSSIVKRIRQIDGPSALVLARYIRKGITTDSQAEQGKFIEAVTKQLYILRNKKFSISSSLIQSIASLCSPSRTGAKVRAVVTYNFDDLLERELKSRQIQFRSIFEEIDLPSQEDLPIYHVHGFLPENRSEYQNLGKSTLVFSEERYHQIYREAYHWSNLTQLSSLKETTCLMVGISLSDPNLRRLLEISSKSIDKPKHFAFVKRISYENFHREDDKVVVRAPATTIRKFLDRHHKLNEEVLRELGVNVIWYENYEEIPPILNRIGRSG